MPDRDEDTVIHGTTNVFADLGRPDAETQLLKAHLVARLQDIIDARGLSQSAAAEVLGMTQPDLANILRGRFRECPIERLLRLLAEMDQDVDIVVRPKQGLHEKGEVSVLITGR